MSEYYILVDPSGHYRPITATYYAEHPLEMHDNKILRDALRVGTEAGGF